MTARLACALLSALLCAASAGCGGPDQFEGSEGDVRHDGGTKSDGGASQGHTLSLTLSDPVATITSSPKGLRCTHGTCKATFPTGTLVRLTAALDASHQVAGWGCPGVADGSDFLVRLDQDLSCQVTFKAVFALTVKVHGGGSVSSSNTSISCGPRCTALVDAAWGASLQATPDAHNRFQQWTGSPACLVAPATGTLLVQAQAGSAVTCEAWFAEPPQQATLQWAVGAPGPANDLVWFGADKVVSWSDGDFRVFEVPSGHFLSMLQVPWGEPTVSKMVAVAANGPSGLVAYADDQGRVIWAKPATALLAVRSAMMTGLGTLTALAFNPDGTRLAAGTDSGRVYIIDVAAQAVVAMPQLASGVTSLAWSPDGGNLAASGPGSLDVFLTNNFAKATSRTVGGALLALRFSADGKRLLGERLGGGFVDASLASGGYTFTPATSCSRPRFGASANRVYFSCPNGDVTVLDLGTGRFLAPISGLGQGTVSELSPDGVHVAALRLVDSSLASEHALTLYRADSGAQVAAARGNGALYSLEPSPVGSSLYVGGNNGLVSELDASTGRYLRDVVRFPAAQRMNWIGMLHASPDGSRLSIGSAGAGSVVIDPRSGQTLLQLGKDRYPRAFSKTNTLAVDYQGPGSADAFELYPAGAAAPTATLPGNWAGVFAGGGTSLYVINDGGVQRWNPATSQPTPLARVVNQNWSLALSPDERTLAVLSMPGPTLIDVTTGTEHVLGRTQRDYFGVLAWRPDGSLLAIAGDQTIDLVRPDTGAVVFSVPGYQDASWSPDGSVLYTPMQQGGVVTAWAIPSTP